MKRSPPLIPALLLVLGAVPAAAQQLTVVNFGGANGAAQKKAFYQPFEKASGAKVVPVEYNGEQAKIKAMVEARKVTWDVVEAESADLDRGCDEGLYERLDWSRLGGKADFLPAAVHECGVGIFVWSSALAYDAGRLKEPPRGWADFWDVKRFPGKRALRKAARFNLEFALMADGVAPADVYATLSTPEGVDRAFAKLDSIKADIVWWEAGAQPPQLLADGEVAMSMAYNGRIFNAAIAEAKPFQIVWDGQIYENEMYAIPKGAPNMEEAKQFIAFATSTDGLRQQAQWISYGPARKSALAEPLIFNDGKTEMAPHLPTAPENMKNALESNWEFWVDRDAELNERFNAWLAAG